MSPDPASDLARLRALCQALPRAAEKVSHGQPCFFIEKGKAFAWFLHDHHGSGITAVALKTGGSDEQAMLVEAEPDIFYRPPYLWPSGWIALRLDRPGTDWVQVETRIARSWVLAAPPRPREQTGR